MTQWPINHNNAPNLTDARYSITREFCGYEKARFVFRFCDDFISTHESHALATEAAKQYQQTRKD